MIRILIADDHPIVRSGFKQILMDYPDIEVGGEAESSQQVIQLLTTSRWDAVVLDISMPGRGGLETLVEIKRLTPRLPVLILSMHPESLYGIRALKAGASGYLLKKSAPDDLVNAIRAVVRGRRFISPLLAEYLASELSGEAGHAKHEMLSSREYEVFRMIATGRHLHDIARELSLSEKTITTYRARILRKMGFTTNAELITYAVKNELLDS
ncbi:MAG: response regulator transcription factor [Candidatus Sumerlaeaceae bacterium]|nr:response regulator transcription factor [Candidatus Sumerlaeaceae bacterium]